MKHTEDGCIVCAGCRQHGITDEREVEWVHRYVGAEADLVDILMDAEDEGYDLDTEAVTAISDMVFQQNEDPSKLN